MVIEKKWIGLPRLEGTTSRQAHADLPEGTYERELAREAYFGPATQMYHQNPPTGWIEWEGPHRPRAFSCPKVAESPETPWKAATILHNAHLRYRFWRTSGKMPRLARNGDGDDLLFIHHGQGHFFCDYGHLEIRSGDYLMVPRGTMWRTEFEGPAQVLMIEATNDSYGIPDRGLLGQHTYFDPAILDTPKLNDRFKAQQTKPGEKETWQLDIKVQNEVSRVTYPYNPLDAVGWNGNLCVLRLNMDDVRPIQSHRYLVPPSAHCTWRAKEFFVHSFVPRPMVSEPGAIKVPFFHNNEDMEEVMFYHRGNFFSRDNIDEGSVTLHPHGITHGPHPKALAGVLQSNKSFTNEYAVMMESRHPLHCGEEGLAVEDPNYVYSWRPKE